jgi:tryptophan halogenase
VKLHYRAQQRDDSPLWRYCREMSIPETLQNKMDLFQSQGRLLSEEYELFAQGSWFQVMTGQGLRPRGYNAIVDVINAGDISQFIEGIRGAVKNCLDVMPTHEEFIAKNCKAPPIGAVR